MANNHTLMFGSGSYINNVKWYVVDDSADKEEIDVSQLSPGSKVYAINDAQWFILNNAKEWEPYSEAGGGSGSGDVPTGAAGQYVGYNSEGAIAVTPDNTPKLNSNKLITSGAVYSALDALPEGLVFRGVVNYRSQLPTSTANPGDVYLVRYSGSSGTNLNEVEYFYGEKNGSLQWILLGPDVSTLRSDVNNKSNKITRRDYYCEGGAMYTLSEKEVVSFLEMEGSENPWTALNISFNSQVEELNHFHFIVWTPSERSIVLYLPGYVYIDAAEDSSGTASPEIVLDPNSYYEFDFLDNFGVMLSWTL